MTTKQHPVLTHAELELVQEYRLETGFNLGFVVLYEGEICGWKRFLDNASGYVPGCIAVSPGEIACFESVGGNDYDGAHSWVLITNLTALKAGRKGGAA